MIPGLLALGSQLFGQAMDKGVDKVMGVPTPSSPTGSEMGLKNQEFLDASFPGTTAWERLGSSAGYGSASSAEISARNQRYVMQEQQRQEQRNKDLDRENALKINELISRRDFVSKAMQYGPEGLKAAQSLLDTGSSGDFSTPNVREKEQFDIKKKAGVYQSEARTEEIESRMRGLMAPTKAGLDAIAPGLGSVVGLAGASAWLNRKPKTSASPEIRIGERDKESGMSYDEIRERSKQKGRSDLSY